MAICIWKPTARDVNNQVFCYSIFSDYSNHLLVGIFKWLFDCFKKTHCKDLGNWDICTSRAARGGGGSFNKRRWYPQQQRASLNWILITNFSLPLIYWLSMQPEASILILAKYKSIFSKYNGRLLKYKNLLSGCKSILSNYKSTLSE